MFQGIIMSIPSKNVTGWYIKVSSAQVTRILNETTNIRHFTIYNVCYGFCHFERNASKGIWHILWVRPWAFHYLITHNKYMQRTEISTSIYHIYLYLYHTNIWISLKKKWKTVSIQNTVLKRSRKKVMRFKYEVSF